jgi:hypothetical protein
MTDLVFMDTETLGLDPDAPIWEFAGIRRGPNTGAPGCVVEAELRLFIRHDPLPWMREYPERFAHDYRQRYNADAALEEELAAKAIFAFTTGAVVIGAVPSFDTERITKLLKRHGYDWGWHYHLMDVENAVVGYLAAQGRVMPPPWDSDELSNALGVDPERYARHTALGDVQWTMAQWDAMMGAPTKSKLAPL